MVVSWHLPGGTEEILKPICLQNTFYCSNWCTLLQNRRNVKTLKTVTFAPTCFGSRRNHHQGGVLCLAKTTSVVFCCACRYRRSQCYGGISACCAVFKCFNISTILWQCASVGTVLLFYWRTVQTWRLCFQFVPTRKDASQVMTIRFQLANWLT